jgi:hypothetical protein
MTKQNEIERLRIRTKTTSQEAVCESVYISFHSLRGIDDETDIELP